MINLFNTRIENRRGNKSHPKRNYDSTEVHAHQPFLFMPPWLQHLQNFLVIDYFVIEQLRFEDLATVGMCLTQKPDLVEALTLMIEEYCPTEHTLHLPSQERTKRNEDPTPTIGLTLAKLDGHLRILKSIPQVYTMAETEAAATGQDPEDLLASLDFLVGAMEKLQETLISLPVFESGYNPFDFLTQSTQDRTGYLNALHEDLTNLFFDDEQISYIYVREKYGELNDQDAFALFLLALKLRTIINKWCAVQRNMIESMFNDWNDFYELRRSPTLKEIQERYPCASALEVVHIHRCICEGLDLSVPNPLENFLRLFFGYFCPKFEWKKDDKQMFLPPEFLHKLWLSPITKQRLSKYIRKKYANVRQTVHPELVTPDHSAGLSGEALLAHYFPPEATPTELIEQGYLSSEHATRKDAHKRNGDTLKHTFRFSNSSENDYKTTIDIFPGTVVWDLGDEHSGVKPHWSIFNRVSTLPVLNEHTKLKILLTLLATRCHILSDLGGQKEPTTGNDYRFFFNETVIDPNTELQLDKLPAFYYVVETPDPDQPETYQRVEISTDESRHLLALFQRLVHILVANKHVLNPILATMEKRKLTPKNPKIMQYEQVDADASQLAAEA